MSFLVGLDLNDVQVQTDSGNASTTAFTLDVASTTNAVAAYISGVRQLAGTDYTVASTTITFTTAPPTGTNNIMYVYTKAAVVNVPASDSVDGTKIADNAIDSEHYTDGSIDTVHIADDQITGAKLGVSLVQGDLLVATGTDTLNRLAKGSADQVLTMNDGATAAGWETAGGGGAWTLISSQTASTSATLDVTGISTTYDAYAFSCTNLTPSSAGTAVVLRCGDSSGFDSGSTDYGYHCSNVTDVSSATYAGQSHAERAHIHMALSINTTTGDHAVVNGYFAGGMDGVGMFYAHGTHVNDNTGADFSGGHWHGARNAVITVDRVQILMETGNIVTGRFTVWGLKHT